MVTLIYRLCQFDRYNFSIKNVNGSNSNYGCVLRILQHSDQDWAKGVLVKLEAVLKKRGSKSQVTS